MYKKEIRAGARIYQAARSHIYGRPPQYVRAGARIWQEPVLLPANPSLAPCKPQSFPLQVLVLHFHDVVANVLFSLFYTFISSFSYFFYTFVPKQEHV